MLYISYGRKLFTKADGIAADFCPICRCASVVEVKQIRSQQHVYHIGIGKGELVGRTVRCRACGSEWPVQAGTIKASVDASVPVTLATLLSETYPRFAIVNGERLEYEAAIARNPFSLAVSTRRELIAEPFVILHREMRRDLEQKNSWQKIIAAVTVTGACGFGLTALFAFLTPNVLVGYGALVLTAGFAYATHRLMAAATEQYMAERIYPRLVSCLAPLRPTQQELQDVVAQLRSHSKCAERTRVDRLTSMIEDYRAPVAAALHPGER
jgi:hypothetical protein